jgi:hypothetical protein
MRGSIYLPLLRLADALAGDAAPAAAAGTIPGPDVPTASLCCFPSFLTPDLQDDMRRLQMERFRRLLVNFDDDNTGSPGNDDDDGEVEVWCL